MVYEGTDEIKNRYKDLIRLYAAEYRYVENPYPENELPDLDYGGCKYLGYAGIATNNKTPEYFFKCYCSNTFKADASKVIKKVNPSCGCNTETYINKVSSSLFELHMEKWNPDTDNPLEKKIPIFSGIVGREKIIGHSLVDQDVYKVWSKIMWVFNKTGYVISNYSKDNCRRLGIPLPKGRENLTLALHRCVLGLGHVTGYNADHINGVVSDNRSSNLRVATPAENSYNKNKVNNKHKLLGVKRLPRKERYSKTGKRNKLWVAQVMLDREYRTKFFHTKEEASWYRDLMAVDLHGEFASLNHPENLEEYKSKLHTLHYK